MDPKVHDRTYSRNSASTIEADDEMNVKVDQQDKNKEIENDGKTKQKTLFVQAQAHKTAKGNLADGSGEIQQETCQAAGSLTYDLRRVPKKRSIGCEYTLDKPRKYMKVYCLCRKPNDGKLYWACDGCNGRFHPSCVGENDMTEPDEYFCPSCKKLKPKENEDRFIAVRGERIYIQDPDEVEKGLQCDDAEDKKEVDILEHIENDSDDIQITEDNSSLFKNYDQIMDKLKETVICDNKKCTLKEHKRHHLFCWNFTQFIQHNNRCHNFGRNFVTFEEETCLTMRLMRDLCTSKADPKRSTGTLPIGTLKIVRDGSKLDMVLTETKIFSSQYILYVLLKDYIVRHVALQKRWTLKMSQVKCQETEINTKEINKRNR